jgi:hypothetical protein
VILVLLLNHLQYCVANPIDSSFNLMPVTASTDSIKHKYNYSGDAFCNCDDDKLASEVPPREVNTSNLERHKSEKEFQYERTVKDEASSFWSNLRKWIIEKLFGKVTKENATLVKNIFYWLIAIFAIFIVGFWLYKTEFLGKPLRRTTKINNVLFDETERSEEDIGYRINEALKKEDYPLAIRWVYIKCIKALSTRNQIDIRQDKTNYDYYLEIKNRDLQQYFFKLTRLFEYTNYGDFTSTLENYTEAEEIFKMINSRI